MAMTGGIARLLHTGIPNYGAATNYPVKLYAYYKSKQDQETNKSTVYLGMYVVISSGYPVGPWTDYHGSYIGAEDNTFDGSIAKGTGTKWLVENKTIVVAHDDSTGAAKVKIPWKWGVYSSWGQFEDESGFFEITLPTIPRASTVGATDANIGAKSSIVVNRKSTDYEHSIAYKFGSLTGYITAAGGVSTTEVKYDTTSIAWTIPATFYAQIPNAKTGTCTLTIRTYSGTTQIGTAQTDTFTVTASKALCEPSVSGVVLDSNAETKALTGDNTKLVRYKSTAHCSITATPKNGATISEMKIGGVVSADGIRGIPEIEVDSIEFYALDSRGYSTAVDVGFDLIPYVLLTNNAEASRVDPGTGVSTLTVQGNYFNGSFGAADNALTIRYSVDGGDYVDVEPTITADGYKATVEITGLDYTVSHTVEVYAADLLDTVPKTVTVGKSIPPFYWNETLFGFTTNIVAPQFIKAGIIKITPSAIDTPTVGEVVFDVPFDGAPYVTLTPVSSVPGTQLKGVSLLGVTENGFKVYVTRSNVVETWVHWIAVYLPADPLERSTYSMSETNEEGGDA